ncbi:hypothetical protein P2A95_01245, partial [Xanthomonas perforans]
HTGISFAQEADDLFFRKTLLHVQSPRVRELDSKLRCYSKSGGRRDLRNSLGKVVQRLDPKDFETLVDMMFLAAGWRRLGRVGSTEKTKDLDLQMPVTGETAWVQIKCASNVGVFNRYLKDNEKMSQYDRMFFVYHTGEEIRSDQENVDVLGLEKVVDMVINGGFVDWVLERAR